MFFYIYANIYLYYKLYTIFYETNFKHITTGTPNCRH